jgi:16S rRNA (cytosine967-C5)-methyltransferase
LPWRAVLPDPQILAARTVIEVLEGRNLNQALQTMLSHHSLTPQQRAAVQDMSYGTVRYYGRLAGILEKLAPKPVTDPEIRCLLLVGLYQLIYGKTREYAVVNEAVKSARATGKSWATGFVNGVLRNFQRKREELLADVDKQAPARFSHPKWWIDKLRSQYPQEWERILQMNNSHPPMTLRVNRRHTDADSYLELLKEQDLQAEFLGGEAIQLNAPVSVEKLPHFADGWVSVQDAGAQYAAHLLDVKDGMRVLDACAAPGGKSAHLLENCDVELTAMDNDGERLKRVEENLARLNLQARTVVGDAANPDAWWDGKPFDRILADVPCSASGVVRRHPDIKWLRRPSDIAKFASTQAEILDALWKVLARGGKLLYATCSVFAEENQNQVAAFRHRHPDAELISPSEGQDLHGQLLPDAHHDGFFYALLFKR